MNTHNDLASLAELLRHRATELTQMSVVVGFDGFVDEMITVVQERQGLHQWSPVKDINAFGDWIKSAAGRSSLREIVVHRVDPGGCAVNLGDALAALGMPLDCFATLGQPRHAAFDSFAQKCRSCHTWGREPGRTLAFEFSDGKLMFSAVTQLAEFDPSLLDRMLADGQYAAACQEARLIALTDWTLYPHMTACWRKLQTQVYAKLKHRPPFFLDLVDPTSRSREDVLEMLAVLRLFENYGPVILGLNGNEGNVLARALGLPTAIEDMAAVQNQTQRLREMLGISQVVIHAVKLAAMAKSGAVAGTYGPYCPNPKKSTGAGDRFNGGYCVGVLLGLSPEQCLILGSAASGFFVRQARSASTLELAQFIENWAGGQLESL
jgi:sugar/nucleoside kinase (ribokinase family)